jgi:hypothetical protein
MMVLPHFPLPRGDGHLSSLLGEAGPPNALTRPGLTLLMQPLSGGGDRIGRGLSLDVHSPMGNNHLSRQQR